MYCIYELSIFMYVNKGQYSIKVMISTKYDFKIIRAYITHFHVVKKKRFL